MRAVDFRKTSGEPTEPLGYTLTLRVEAQNRPGTLGKITSTIGEFGGNIGALDIVDVGKGKIIRDITVMLREVGRVQEIVKALKGIEGVRVINVSDKVFLAHLGGKIELKSRVPLKTRDDLSIAYTPGVARVCMAIRENEEKAFTLTCKKNMVAVVTDGTAVLGLGDIGPRAALPVMEGKAVLFKEFGGVDAFPVCLDTKDEDRIVEIVKAIAPSFGGINLEDISAPRCFSIEERLREELDIPVFHDDQHGTAIVTVAALTNALRIVKKDFEEIRVVFSGVGAAGIAVSKILMASGVRHIIGCDKTGAVYRGRVENMNFMKDWFAEHTNSEGLRGTLADALEGADVFIGLSGPGVLTVEMLKKMARDPIVFAMANPEPEIRPEVAQPYVRIMATGRSDYPNQINNVLAFPGVFRGALDCRARSINEEMKKAAALALANLIPKSELSEDYIIPSVFNKRVAKLVAAAVMKAAAQTGVARRAHKHTLMDLL